MLLDLAVDTAEGASFAHVADLYGNVFVLVQLPIVAGGVVLLRGVWRGRIAVRDPAGRAFRERR